MKMKLMIGVVLFLIFASMLFAPIQAESMIEQRYTNTLRPILTSATYNEMPWIPIEKKETLNMGESHGIPFYAEEGDKIHFQVKVVDGGDIACALIPAEEWVQFKNGLNVRVIEEGSRQQTNNFKVSLTIPEDGNYIIAITPSFFSSTVRILYGRGPLSAVVVRVGGTTNFSAIFFSCLAAIVISYAIYMKKKYLKNKGIESTEEEEKEPEDLSENQLSEPPPPPPIYSLDHVCPYCNEVMQKNWLVCGYCGKTVSKRCSHCNATTPLESKRCKQCGFEEPTMCKRCGLKIPPDLCDKLKFCPECGEGL